MSWKIINFEIENVEFVDCPKCGKLAEGPLHYEILNDWTIKLLYECRHCGLQFYIRYKLVPIGWKESD